jgi:hypothetical protein
MALVAVASDKGAPGVTTASVVLAAVWPRPVLLAECDPAGGDLVYRFPAADGGRLDPGLGLLSLAVTARRGLRPEQVWEHTQTLRGGLAVLTGVSTAEQGAGLDPLWGPVGSVLAQLPQGDVIADCGRLGVDGPQHDLLAQAAAVVLVTRHDLGEVVRLRERVPALAAALDRRDRLSTTIRVVVIADHRRFHAALAEVGEALGHGKGMIDVLGGLAYDPRAARQLRGEWGGRLDRSLLARTARDVAGHLAGPLPALSMPVPGGPPGAGLHGGGLRSAGLHRSGPDGDGQPRDGPRDGVPLSGAQHGAGQHGGGQHSRGRHAGRPAPVTPSGTTPSGTMASGSTASGTMASGGRG